MLVRLARTSRAPLFAQIASSIREDVSTGRLSPGDRLPTGRLLAEALNVNSHTVLRAYQMLRDEGLIEIRRGRGAAVAAPGDPFTDVRAALERAAATAARSGIKRQTLHGILRTVCNERGVEQ